MKKFKVGDRVKHCDLKWECIIVSLRAKMKWKPLLSWQKIIIERNDDLWRDRDNDIPVRYVSKLGNTYWYCSPDYLEHVE